MADDTALRARLSAAVAEAGLTAEEIAAASGWDVHRIRCVLSGTARPSPLDVTLVAWATGTDIPALVAGTDIPEGMVRQGVRAMPGGVCLRRHA